MNRKPSLFSRLMTGLIFLFLYAPIFVLIIFSFNNSKSRSVWAGFTLDWYDKLFHDQMILDALYTTLAVSVLAAVIATVAGTFAAIGFYNMKKRWRTPLMTVNNIPMVNAEIVTGVSLCLFFVAFFNLWGDFAHWVNGAFGLQLPEQLYLGFGTMLIAHITFNIPYVILSIMPKLRQTDRHLYEAALDLGCHPFPAFLRVVMPQILPGVVTGALMAFTMSLDDFVISLFTSGSQAQNLSVTIYAMVKRRVTPEINALSTLMFGAILLLLILVNVAQIRGQPKARPAR